MSEINAKPKIAYGTFFAGTFLLIRTGVRGQRT